MFFKHELCFIIAKNKLYRKSNLFSIPAIRRVLPFFFRKKICANYISNLLQNKKSLQFIYLFENYPFMISDLKFYFNQLGFEGICPKHRFCKPIFDFICSKIIELDIPIDTWEHLTEDNNYIDEYAKKKLLKLRNEYIALKQKQYNFPLKKAELLIDNLERIEGI